MHRKVEYTYWIIQDFLLEEPIGVLTNLMLVMLAGIYGYRLWKSGMTFPSYFFFSLLAAHFCDALAHGFFYYFGENMHFAGWTLSAFTLLLLEQDSILTHCNKYQRGLRLVSFLKFLIFLPLALGLRDFLAVNINFGIGVLLIVLPLKIKSVVQLKDRSSRLFLYAIGFLFLPGIVSTTRWNPHVWFNSNDLGHVLLGIAFWMIYRSFSSRYSSQT